MTQKAMSSDACVLCGGPQRARYHLGSHRLLYCPRCDLGQLSPLPTDAELQALYASEEYFAGGGAGYADYAADDPQHARSFRARLEWLLRTGPVDDLLEIGCGPGLFPVEARRLGVPHVVGVDPNPWAVAQARAHGVDAHVSGRRWVSLKPPEHVRYFSSRGVRRLLRAAGFDVLIIRAARQYVTVAFVLTRLERLVPRPGRVLRRVAAALRLSDRVVFVTNGSIDVLAR